MRDVKIEPITEAGFAPFGKLLQVPAPGQANLDFSGILQNYRAGAKVKVSLVALDPTALPMTITEMERHRFSSQAFVPGGCREYLVLVAASDEYDRPDPKTLRAFKVPGTVGINYNAGTWHHPMRVLHAPANFTAVMFADGSSDD